MTTAPQWLKRYLEGEHEVVWHELRRLGARVREPAFAPEAQAVCDEMARRARSNIELMVERLVQQGYRFHENDEARAPAQPLTGPVADADGFVAWMEQTFGPVPMVVSSWVRIVGDVWLVGTHPAWDTSAAADPLVVEVAGTRYAGHDIRPYLQDELESWRETAEGRPFQLPVAPDHLHKNNISGGPPYGIELPDACADAHIVTDTGMPFVSYLRSVFEHGGFPRWSGDDRQWAVTRSLADGLKPV
ncbi:hypothetical protein [Cellulomonas denverensis]|uniref:Uncharacterized protein n=1 Tax=Cellulomonas denverensis TaxID=264297 RepID=A0A7X6KSB9_9CELL|nr:hypothetical protein [Cellulomonas denverensis]NKY21332.1 hypothetical protein [Cellulomonas denverensis]